jgi:hypothetical protein
MTPRDGRTEGEVMAWLTELRKRGDEQRKRGADPLRNVLNRTVPANVTSMSTVALLDLLDLPATTGNARRLARTMRSMGWISLKSRRLMPGGFRDTTIRGWARSVRAPQGLSPVNVIGSTGVTSQGGEDESAD